MALSGWCSVDVEAQYWRLRSILEALRKGYHLGRDASPALVVVIPKIRMLKLDNVREGTLEPEAYRRLLGFLPFYLQMVLVIGYHYGIGRARFSSSGGIRSTGPAT